MEGRTLIEADRTAGTPVALSTSSVYPDRTPEAFEAAVRLGYDGIEVMVYTDPVSQDVDVLSRLTDYHQLPVLAVHAPSLLLTQLIWGREPWEKLRRSKDLAERLGAKVVVVHPPFRWQRDYAVGFEAGIAAMAQETDVIFAVENMFPLRPGGREIFPYAPTWDPTGMECAHVTLDLSHTAASGSDALAMTAELGSRLAHVHLVPGRGSQPCAEVLHQLTADGYPGVVVLEVNTRRALNREERMTDLAESLAFAREHLTQVPAR